MADIDSSTGARGSTLKHELGEGDAMDLFSKWAWLVVSWMTPGQRVSPDTGTDFGDMGTAFGMDAYLSRPGGDDSAASRFSAQPERRPAKN